MTYEERYRSRLRIWLKEKRLCDVFPKERTLPLYKKSLRTQKPDIIAVRNDGKKVYIIECKKSDSLSLAKISRVIGQILVDKVIIETLRKKKRSLWIRFLKRNIKDNDISISEHHNVVYGIGIPYPYKNDATRSIINKIKRMYGIKVFYIKNKKVVVTR